MNYYTVKLVNADGVRLWTCKVIKDTTKLPLKTCLLLHDNIPFLIYSGSCRNTARKIARDFREIGCTVESKIS